jgi:hypothetical protein
MSGFILVKVLILVCLCAILALLFNGTGIEVRIPAVRMRSQILYVDLAEPDSQTGTVFA